MESKINNIYAERIAKLRADMKEEGIDVCYLTDADEHGSEYVADAYKMRTYFSGFTGSNGYLLISDKEALLWTDGRYFVQAEAQLMGSGIKLMRMGEEGVLSPLDYFLEQIVEQAVFGFQGKCINAKTILMLLKKAKKKGKEITLYCDLLKLPSVQEFQTKCTFQKSVILPLSLSGQRTSEKLKKLRLYMEDKKTDFCTISSLEEIMWLFNLRGSDIVCNPVIISYALIDKINAFIYVNAAAKTEELENYARKEGFTVLSYDDIYECDRFMEENDRVLLDGSSLSYTIYERIHAKCKIEEESSVIQKWKAVKNETEMNNLSEVYLRDSAAVCKFLYRLEEEQKANTQVTELMAAEWMDALRKEAGCNDLSFPTISAYGANAAMMHYEPSIEHPVTIEKEGMFLIDSGGQYDGGTTDVTRTVAVGKTTQEMQHFYTLSLKGLLNLQNAVFKKDMKGSQLDILARSFLWQEGMDYRCGTGHGVGYMLSVHEGPQSIRSKIGESEACFEPGMLVSNEPGFYKDREFGIRIENIMLCMLKEVTEYGTFLHFEPLTYVPFDKRLICVEELTGMEIQNINSYHRAVYDKISPFLDKNERKWLQEACEFY